MSNAHHAMLRYLALAALAVAIVIACRHVDGAALAAALGRAAWWPLAPALAVLLVARTAARARRTQLVLARVDLATIVRLTLAGYAAATLVPGPSEGVLWCTQLAKQRGFTLRELARFQVTDKALVAGSIGLVALGVWSWQLAIAVVALGALAAPGLVLPLGWLVVSHLASAAMLALCLAAVGIATSPGVCAELVVATSIAGVLVFVPGQLGTFESAFMLVALRHGLPTAPALAAAVLYHAADVVPATLAGLPGLAKIVSRRNTPAITG